VVMFLGGSGPYSAVLRLTNPDGKSASAAFEVTAQRAGAAGPTELPRASRVSGRPND
jgi:hypothetical protein